MKACLLLATALPTILGVVGAADSCAEVAAPVIAAAASPAEVETDPGVASSAAANAAIGEGASNPAAAAARPMLGTHPVVLDDSGKIVPWTENPADGYDRVIHLSWDLLKNRIPIDPANNLPVIYTHSEYLQGSLQGSGWPNNPAGKNAMLADAAAMYFAYSGDRAVIDLVRGLLDHQLAHGTTPADYPWPQVPYSTARAGSIDYGDDDMREGTGVIEPDKLGELGFYGYLNFFKLTGEEKYLKAAIACADALASHVRPGDATHSPWPFRVVAQSGETAQGEEYCADVIAPIKLFEELIRLGHGNVAAYQAACDKAWAWLVAYPLENDAWANYFEDVPPVSDVRMNVNQYCPGETARYLMQHPQKDPQWRQHVARMLNWIESRFGGPSSGDPDYGATLISEQVLYDYKMASHTSRFAADKALYYALTGDLAAKEAAYRSLNWCTYMCRDDGEVIEGPSEEKINPACWFTDGHGDYIRHFLRALGAVPAWAPAGQTHLTGSTSLVTAAVYDATGVRFTTFDAGARESLRLAFAPAQVLVDGVVLPQRGDVNAPGWTFDAATGVLRIRHDSGKSVQVLAAPPNAVTLTIDGHQRFQTIDGIGVNANHRSWSGEELKPVLDQLMNTAGMNLFRVVYDNADWEAVNDNADPNVFNWEYYNSVFGGAKFEKLWEMLAYLDQRGAADGICLNIMGPGPSWMGGTTLAAGMEDEWAESVAALVIYARQTRGLRFTLLSPTNEPDIFNEGVHMTSAQYATALHKLAEKLDANGLGDIRFVAPDAAGDLGYLTPILADPLVMRTLKHWGIHSYSNGGASDTAAEVIRKSAYPDRSLWLTEFNVWLPGADNGQRGTYDWNYCRGSAEYLLNHLAHGAAGAIVWEGYDSDYAHPPACWSYWGILGVDDEKAAVKSYTPRKNFYTLAQISKFVRPGMVRIGARVDGDAIVAQAFLDPATGAVSIVGINFGSMPVALNGQLRGASATALRLYATNATALNLSPAGEVGVRGRRFGVQVPADSVFTLTSWQDARPAMAPRRAGTKREPQRATQATIP